MAIFGSFGHCLPNILHTWPPDSFQVIRLSMTLGIFQSHWTVLHQISQKRCVIRQKLLWTTNRKSYTSFRLVQLWWPWSTFESHFSLYIGCHFHVHFNYPWHALAELLVTVRRYALHGLWDRNSVCPSVTLVHCVHMVRPTIMISLPHGSPIILVSGDITFITKFEGGHPERGRWMRVGWVRIDDFRPISRRISETVRDTTKVTINH